MFRISAETKQHPTELPERIIQALRTILEEGEVEERRVGEETYLSIESSSYSALENLYLLFRKQRILDVARKQLRAGLVGNSTVFFLNKQIAFVGKVNFCEVKGESALGPIRVEIQDDEITRLIEWLAPYTKNGTEVKLVEKFP